MDIQTYQPNINHLAELIDLVLYCQNIEAHLQIGLADQPDLLTIPNYYQANGGNFWLALDQDHVVGTIALLKLDAKTAVLKKLFTYPDYRGQPTRLGQQLLTRLLAEAKRQGLHRLVLDTPAGEQRSHHFYEKNGFKQISKVALNANYAYPDRDSLYYELILD